MKIVSFLVASALVTALVSFNRSNDEKEVKYVLDTKKSSLKWKAGKNENYFHVGTVDFKEGHIEMENGMLHDGEFEVDLASIKVVDEGLPKEKREKLAGHLQTEDFFNVAKYATAEVEVGSYKEDKLHTTVTVLGVPVTQDVPVTLITSDKGLTIEGTFDFDFSAANIPGTQLHEGETERISPVFHFDLHLELSK